MNALQHCLCQFAHKKLVAYFLQAKCDLDGKRPFCVLSPLGDLWATYDDHLRLIGKRVVDFLLVLIERFSLGVTAKALAIICSKSAISPPVDPKF